MPVRHRKKSTTSYLGWVQVPVAGRPIRHESSLERDFLHWMPFISPLVRIEEQPLRIIDPYHAYTPDFNLELRVQASRFHGIEFTHLIEVKPYPVLQRTWEKLRPRMELGLDYSHSKGWNFKILTELEIRSADLPIVQFLRRFINAVPNQDLEVWVLQQLVDKPLSLLDILSRIRKVLGIDPRQSLPAIWHFLSKRAVYLGDPPSLTYQSLISHPESIHSKVWIPGERLTRILLDPWEMRPRASRE